MDEFIVLDNEIARLYFHITDLQYQVTQAYTRIRQLRTHRNALTSLCRLPADLIFRILQVLAPFDYAFSHRNRAVGSRRPQRYSTEWTRVSGICTHVRSVALGSPILWSYIDLNQNRDWVDLCITRAGSSALSLSYNEELPRVRRKTLKLLMPRAREAQIILAADGPAIDMIFNHSLPSLHSLWYSPPPSQTLMLSTAFLSGAPSLTKLVLRNICLSADDISFPSLIYLDLDGVSVQNKSERLLYLLESAPRLQYLYLRNVVFAQMNEYFTSIRLFYLLVAHIEDTLASISAFMRILPIPQHEYRLSVLPSSSLAEDNPDLIELRKQVFEQALRTLDFEKNLSNHRVVHISQRSRSIPRGVRYLLTLQHPMRKVSYVDECSTIVGLRGILDSIQELHIHELALQAVFAYAANDPAHALRAIQHLVIHKGKGSLYDLKTWLYARYVAGRRIRVMDFRNCSEYIANYGSIATVREIFCGNNGVEEVLEDGHLVVC